MSNPNPCRLDFAWAEKRWPDPVSRREVVRISPESHNHFRTNYFRYNAFTPDGNTMILSELPDLVNDCDVRYWAVDLATGERRDLGSMPEKASLVMGTHYIVSRHAPVIQTWDINKNLVLLDINARTQSPLEIDPLLPLVGALTCDGRKYLGYWDSWWEKTAQTKPDFAGFWENEWITRSKARSNNAIFQVDMETCQVEKIFETDEWWIGHPNPNPVNPDLYMWCQEGAREEIESFERIRLLRLSDRRWRTVFNPDHPWRLKDDKLHRYQGTHEYWSQDGRRIYAHMPVYMDLIMVYDLDTGEEKYYPTAQPESYSIHTHISPDERFICGDGDYENQKIYRYDLLRACPSPGQAEDGLYKEVTPLCSWRSALPGTARPSESNARVSPDSQWVIFTSANDQGKLEVRAVRAESM